jgi:hypothetical protein
MRTCYNDDTQHRDAKELCVAHRYITSSIDPAHKQVELDSHKQCASNAYGAEPPHHAATGTATRAVTQIRWPESCQAPPTTLLPVRMIVHGWHLQRQATATVSLCQSARSCQACRRPASTRLGAMPRKQFHTTRVSSSTRRWDSVPRADSAQHRCSQLRAGRLVPGSSMALSCAAKPCSSAACTPLQACLDVQTGCLCARSMRCMLHVAEQRAASPLLCLRKASVLSAATLCKSWQCTTKAYGRLSRAVDGRPAHYGKQSKPTSFSP